MEAPFAVNDVVTLIKDKKYICRYGDFSFKLEEIIVPQFTQVLIIRDIINWKDYITGISNYGVRFREIFNPKFSTWVPALGEDRFIHLEPLFNASDFKTVII